jgi:peptidoglycan/LPS O-acetylase OafA/YrhL
MNPKFEDSTRSLAGSNRMNQATAGQVRPTFPPPEKIHALTSLRFFAALFVVLYHATWSFLPWVKHEDPVGKVVSLGYISVSFFFLLSGYILAVVYLRRGGPVPVRSFYRARFARVYPLFFLTLVLDTPVLFLSRLATYGMKSALLKTGVSFAGNAVMLQAWLQQLRGIDNPNWSLSVETLFYLTFPLLGVLLWKLRGIQLWLIAAILYLGGQVLVFVSEQKIPGETTQLFPVLHLSTFALGILLARWQALTRQRRAVSRNAQPKKYAAPVVSLLALAAFGAVVYWAPRSPTANLCDGLLAPIFAGLIWAFSDSDWLPARLLSVPWMVVLGEASFGLYLFHIPVFHLFERLGWNHTPALLPVYLGVSIGVSVLSFYFFETPLRRWILKRGQAPVKETMELASDPQ